MTDLLVLRLGSVALGALVVAAAACSGSVTPGGAGAGASSAASSGGAGSGGVSTGGTGSTGTPSTGEGGGDQIACLGDGDCAAPSVCVAGACVSVDCPDEDLGADPENCGACGHGCRGGACAAGVCQPVVLAAGQIRPVGITLDATHVYWVNGGETLGSTAPDVAGHPAGNGALMRAPRAGGPAEVLAGDLHWAIDVAVDDTHAFFTTGATSTGWGIFDGTVGRVPKAGGDVQLLGHDQGWPIAIAADAAGVFWVNGVDGTIMALPAGGAVTMFATDQYDANGVGVDAAFVYWTTGSTVRRAPRAGGAPIDLSPPDDTKLDGLSLRGARAYSNDSLGHVIAVPLAGGAKSVIAMGDDVGRTAVFGGRVYWTSPVFGKIMSAPLDGAGPVVEIASGQPSPQDIAVDADAIYWTNGPNTKDGAVMMRAR